MKRKSIFILFFLLIVFPLFVNASSFDTEKGKANSLLGKESYINTFDKYLIDGRNTSIKFKYENGSNKTVEGFTRAGFISRDEYKLTIVRNLSYLFDGV